MKWYWWIGIIIFVGSIVRVLFSMSFPTYRTGGDTVSYYYTAPHIVKNFIVADPWRTPGYPIIIALPYLLEGKEMPRVISQFDFIPEFWSIRVAQIVTGILTLVVLFFLLRALGVSDNHAGAFTLFTACSYPLLLFEYYLVPESFAIFCLMGTVILTIFLLKRFRMWQFLLLMILSIFGFLLRPMSILLPVIFIFILVWHWRTRKVFAASIVAIIMYAGFLTWYSQANYALYQYRGISRISDVNILGKILAYHIPVDSAADSNGVKTIISTYMKGSYNPDPWQVFLQNGALYSASSAMPLHEFVYDVLKHNILIYITKATVDIPSNMVSMALGNEKMDAPGFMGRVFFLLSKIYQYIQIVDLLLVGIVPVMLFVSWRHHTVRNDGILLFSLVGLYHIIAANYVSYSDYMRLMGIAQPIMLFVSFWFLFQLIGAVQRRWRRARTE